MVSSSTASAPVPDGTRRLLGRDVLGGGRRRGEGEQRAGQQQGGEGGERRAGAGARAGTHEPAEGAHERPTDGGRDMFRPPIGRSAGRSRPGQGCQSPVSDDDQAGRGDVGRELEEARGRALQLRELLDQLQGGLALRSRRPR